MQLRICRMDLNGVIALKGDVRDRQMMDVLNDAKNGFLDKEIERCHQSIRCATSRLRRFPRTAKPRVGSGRRSRVEAKLG